MCLQRCFSLKRSLRLPPQATFYQDLNTYLSGPGARFTGDVVYVEEGVAESGIFAARSEVTWRYLEDSRDKVCCDAARAVLCAAPHTEHSCQHISLQW